MSQALSIGHTGEVVGGEFERYREGIDAATEGARKTGLFDEALYYDALEDDRTVVLEEASGSRAPVFTPLKYVAGYDINRCVELTGSSSEDELLYLSVVPGQIEGSTDDLIEALLPHVRPGDKIFFDYGEDDLAAATAYQRILSELPRGVEEITFGSDDNPATLSLFTTQVERKDSSQTINTTPTDIQTEFDNQVATGEVEKWPENGVTVLGAEDIDDELFAKLWSLYENRFQWLGQNHPISMEDTVDEFRDILRKTNPLIPVAFKDGEPACFAYFFDDISMCDWLRADFMNTQAEPERVNLFFGGIVATADGIGGYADKLIESITELAGKTGRKYKVLFESTNVSETYIPEMVSGYINKTESMTCHEPLKVSQHLYRAANVRA